MTTETTAPSSLRAGDSAAWSYSDTTYLATAGWALAYRLVSRSGGASYSISAVANGDAFDVALDASDTAGFAEGNYTLVGAVTLGAERVTVCNQACSVLPDVMEATSLDQRSTARKIVEAIDAWLEGKAGWAGEKTIADRSIKDHPLPDLIVLRDRFMQDVASEDAAASIINGLGSMRGRVMVRM
jgi:hypothetical protein